MASTGFLLIIFLGLSLLISLGGVAVAAGLLVSDHKERGVAIAVLAVAGLCFLATLVAIAAAIIFVLGIV